MPTHDKAFKPAKHVIERYYTAAFENKPERVNVKKDYKDADGVVVIAPKNYATFPPKKGRVGKHCYFNGQVEHMPDDFNWPKKLARTEMDAGKAKEQDKPFSQRAKEIGSFNCTKHVIGEDIAIPARPEKKEMDPPMEQDANWKPAKPPRMGYSCTFEKFPNYMENPLKFTTRRVPVEGEDDMKAFKTATNFRSKPSPSVTCNMRNMKASFPSVFRK